MMLQVLKALQVLAAESELRFEVSKQTAFAFVVKKRPDDLQALAEALSQRHGVVTAQQAQRLDVAYCSFAAAATAASAALGGNAMPAFHHGVGYWQLPTDGLHSTVTLTSSWHLASCCLPLLVAASRAAGNKAAPESHGLHV